MLQHNDYIFFLAYIDSPKFVPSKESDLEKQEKENEKDGEKDDFHINEAFEAGGNFIDDDFGLSLQQESEHIRQQQILIEQEVHNIEIRIYVRKKLILFIGYLQLPCINFLELL